MNNDKHKDIEMLFAAARGYRVDTSAMENNFEKRVLERIREVKSPMSVWSTWEWRLVPAFAILAFILGIVTLTADLYHPQDILASIVSSQENQIVIRYLTGG